jgi:hypothetical protein
MKKLKTLQIFISKSVTYLLYNKGLDFLTVDYFLPKIATDQLILSGTGAKTGLGWL